LFYGVLDGPNRTLQFTNAGHVQPLLIREGSVTQHLENDDALLGVFPEWEYKDSTVELQRGDLLLLFTDGITEAMASDGREFGEERLIEAATSLSVDPLNDLQRGIVEQVKCFCNSHLSDDATLLLIAALRGEPKSGNRAHNEATRSEQIVFTSPTSI
jgi:sigma-B regulation protein RsbU (phosphoserine phosphatase)